MSSCTFFGHRDCSNDIEHSLRHVLTDLIENKNVNFFYVGNNGNFYYIARKTLQSLKINYPHINYWVVLAYMPCKTQKADYHNQSIYPEILDNVPRKYAIIERNKWMINKSDYVVTYVKYNFGGASTFKNLAEQKRKKVINLFNKKSRDD